MRGAAQRRALTATVAVTVAADVVVYAIVGWSGWTAVTAGAVAWTIWFLGEAVYAAGRADAFHEARDLLLGVEEEGER